MQLIGLDRARKLSRLGRNKLAIKEYALPYVSDLLKAAARAQGQVTWSEVWEQFDRVDTMYDQWDTVAEAARQLCPFHKAMYGALMAGKGTGLPGAGFFREFRDARAFDYEELVGDVDPEDLTTRQKTKITLSERENVYKHAAKHL